MADATFSRDCTALKLGHSIPLEVRWAGAFATITICDDPVEGLASAEGT